MDDDMEEVLISSSGYTEQVMKSFWYWAQLMVLSFEFQVSSRKSYKHEDLDDDEETVVLFSREGEGSHDLD